MKKTPWKIVSFLILPLVIAACGGGGGGGSAGNGSGSETIVTQVLATQDEGSQYYNTLSSQNDPDAISKTVNYLKTKSNVTNVVVGDDCTSILVQYDSGVEGIISTNSSAFGTVTAIPARTAKMLSSKYVVKNLDPATQTKKAIILLPFQGEPGTFDNSINSIVSALQRSGYSYAVYVGEDVTLDLIKTLPDYDFIYMTTHGSVTLGRVSITTGQSVDAGFLKVKELWSRLIDGANSGIHIVSIPSVGKSYIGVNNNFIKNYTFASSFVFMNACSSYYNNSLADSFLNNGASVYIGWDHDTFTFLANGHNGNFINELAVQGNTLQNAFSSVLDQYYPAQVYKNSGNDNVHVHLLDGKMFDFQDNAVPIENYVLRIKYKGNNNYVLNSVGSATLPTVQTLVSTLVTTNGATLNGSVNPNGLPTTYWFEYGTSPTLATYSSTATKSAGSGTTSQSFNEAISGLQVGTAYYFRVVASNTGGTIHGTILGFTTVPASSTTFVKIYPGTSAVDGQQTTEGGYIVAGAIGNDPGLLKTDVNGNLLWSRSYPGIIVSMSDSGHSVKQTTDGGYIFAGDVFNSYLGCDALLIKTDQSGNVVWSKTFGHSGYSDSFSEVQKTADGGFIAAGYIHYWSGADVFLVKVDQYGNEIWSRTYDGGTHSDMAFSVQTTSDGGYIVVGSMEDANWISQVWLIKTDVNGNIVWSKTYGGANTNIGYSVRQTVDGGYIVVGQTSSFGLGVTNVYVIKTDSSGNQIWSNAYGASGAYYSGTDIIQTNDGGYIISANTTTPEALIIKISSGGGIMFTKSYAAIGLTEGDSVLRSADGGYLVVGMCGQNTCLVKTDANGDVQ